MRTGARAQAAIEILTAWAAGDGPAADLVKAWMKAHRFAGSKDRGAVGDLVFGALRWKASSAWRLQEDHARAWVFGAQRWGFGLPAEAIEQQCYDDPHAPSPPTEAERAALAAATLDDSPAWVAGDYPEWLDPSLERAFAADRAAEGAALAAPAPLDLRANRLKTDRDALIAALADSAGLEAPPTPTPFAPDGVRTPWRFGKTFPWNVERTFLKGWYEVQDEGSQLAAALAAPQPGWQVADVCAGGGGKTLALAALMGNTGQIYAYDVDPRRLAAVTPRLERAGVRNVQLRAPQRSGQELADLAGRMDLVLVDAPCSGSGTWRRAPETKWRLRPNALKRRLEEQQQALDRAAPLVRPGGRLVYVTCSVLPEENQEAVAAFLARAPDFAPEPIACAAPHWPADPGLQLTPARTGCDGFYFCALRRTGD